jgi:hypothetical protein
MRLLRWIMVLAVVGGLWYVTIAVPLGGSTLQERVGTWAGKLFETTPHATRRSPQVEQTPQPADQLTDTDRKSLNHLIENKLEATSGKPNAAATTKR